MRANTGPPLSPWPAALRKLTSSARVSGPIQPAVVLIHSLTARMTMLHFAPENEPDVHTHRPGKLSQAPATGLENSPTPTPPS